MAAPDPIFLRSATSISDFLFLRKVRNEVRSLMTNRTERIGFIEQLRFYVIRPDNLDIRIVWLDGKRAGYLLVRNEGRNNYVTEAVRDKFRRKGLASFMLRSAILSYPNLIAEIRSDNGPSLALHEAHGFKLVETGAVMTYHHIGTAEIHGPGEI